MNYQLSLRSVPLYPDAHIMKIKKHQWAAAAIALCILIPVQARAADSAKPAAGSAASGSAVVARMGTLEVSRAEIEKIIRALPPQARAQLKADRAAAERLVRSRLADEALLQQAHAKQWDQRPEVKAQIDAATREIIFRSYLASVATVPAGFPSDKELDAAYEQSKGKLVQPAQYRVSQIFFAAPISDPDAVARARKQAVEVAKEARAPKADFDSLVKKYSDDANAKKGSDTGMVTLAQLLPEIRLAVAQLKKGQVSGPVQSAQGFHILKLLDETPQRTATLPEVRDRLRAVMRQERQRQAAQAYLQNLLDKQTVTIDGAALTAVLDSAAK
jgi:peptidylprolyl isomerase